MNICYLLPIRTNQQLPGVAAVLSHLHFDLSFWKLDKRCNLICVPEEIPLWQCINKRYSYKLPLLLVECLLAKRNWIIKNTPCSVHIPLRKIKFLFLCISDRCLPRMYVNKLIVARHYILSKFLHHIEWFAKES